MAALDSRPSPTAISDFSESTGAARLLQQQFQRTYQACQHCRQRKVKCIPEDDPNGSMPTCVKCRRERRICVFSRERKIQRSSEVGDRDHGIGRTVRVVDELPKRRSRRHTSRLTSPLAPQHLDGPLGLDQELSAVQATQTPHGEHPDGWQESLIEGVIDSSITNQRDALHLLYKAIEHSESTHTPGESETPLAPSSEHPDSNAQILPDLSSRRAATKSKEDWCTLRYQLSTPPQRVLEAWAACPFVSQRWMTASEAVTWVDLFFENMAILSPVMDEYYHSYDNHYTLINEEVLLCSTILMLSSRYHHLAGEGSLCRGFLLHERLWKYCKTLFDQIRWGEERSRSGPRIRTIGSIQSLFLIAEWHPRLFHLNLNSDIWPAKPDSTTEATQCLGGWHDLILEPVRKSNRMSWMLLGSALTLSHEIGLFNFAPNEVTHSRLSAPTETRERLKRLFFVFINNLTSRLGCQVPKTPFFHSSILMVLDEPEWTDRLDWREWMEAWIDLTRIVRSSSEILFPDEQVTKQLVQDGRYSELLAHFGHILDQWLEKYPKISGPSVRYGVLLIEFHYIRVYINSLAMQAIANRRKDRPKNALFESDVHPQDRGFVTQVFEGCRAVLEIVLKHSTQGFLKYLPVRVHIQIASTAVYLIKALALGLQEEELNTRALDLLQSTADKLRSDTVDDVYLAIRFASLLETHVQVLRRRFAREAALRTKPQESLSISPTRDGLWQADSTFYDQFIYSDDWLAPQGDAPFFSFDNMSGHNTFDIYGDSFQGMML